MPNVPWDVTCTILPLFLYFNWEKALDFGTSLANPSKSELNDQQSIHGIVFAIN